jgi:hypothetical protein
MSRSGVRMGEEWQPEFTLETKVDQVEQDLVTYIEKNSDKIDSNIPIFFGHVLSIIDNSLPGIDDKTHDRIIDDITLRVLEKSDRSNDVDYIGKLFSHAQRLKRRPGGRMIFDIILGFKLIEIGKYHDAIEQLKKFRRVDAIIYTAIAYCYYILATETVYGDKSGNVGKTSQMALNAREQLIELVRVRPPVNRLKFPQVVKELRINKIFWFMMKLGIEWFPDEPEFLKIGIEKAKLDENQVMRGELLAIAAERYYNDMVFLRELYSYKIEERDAAGAASVVKQMIQHYPQELEPVYYGLQLSIISQQSTAFARFRKLAISNKMPVNILLLLDFTYQLVMGGKTEAFASLDRIKTRLTMKNHYLTLIEYLTDDVFSDDQARAKKARSVLMDSLDQYCLKLVMMKGADGKDI